MSYDSPFFIVNLISDISEFDEQTKSKLIEEYSFNILQKVVQLTALPEEELKDLKNDFSIENLEKLTQAKNLDKQLIKEGLIEYMNELNEILIKEFVSKSSKEQVDKFQSLLQTPQG